MMMAEMVADFARATLVAVVAVVVQAAAAVVMVEVGVAVEVTRRRSATYFARYAD